ncbi:MAG TPA: deaminase, partial [Candidatus Cloacimonadota bacterium]|nr:deaminase [Candidatus Cloacimonadota bacterium]
MNVPSGTMHELCRGVHAEQNAIVQSAINGTSIRNATLYCTNHPCSICAKMIINAEIRNVYIADDYPDPLAKEMFAEAGVELVLVDRENGKLKKLI